MSCFLGKATAPTSTASTLPPSAPSTAAAERYALVQSGGNPQAAASLIGARLHRSLAAADAADAARWCAAMAQLLGTSVAVASSALPKALEGNVLAALAGALRMPSASPTSGGSSAASAAVPFSKATPIVVPRSASVYSAMRRAALEAVGAFSNASLDPALLERARGQAAALGITHLAVVALSAAAHAADPRESPCDEDPRVGLCLAAMRAASFLLGSSGKGKPYGGGTAGRLTHIKQLQMAVASGGASAIGAALTIGGAESEELSVVALGLLECLTRPMGGLPVGIASHAGVRSERVASDEAHAPAIAAMVAHPSSLRVQRAGLSLISNLSDGSGGAAGGGAANRAQLLVDAGGLNACLVAMWNHSLASAELALAGSWAIQGLCAGSAPPARGRALQAVQEGAFAALTSAMRQWGSKLGNLDEAVRSALSAIMGGQQGDGELRLAAEEAGVRTEWLRWS